MTSEGVVPVTQADREAAANLIAAQLGPSASRYAGPDKARSGASDAGLLVQAFARHRLSTPPAASVQGEELREALIARIDAWQEQAGLDGAADLLADCRAALNGRSAS